MTGVAVSNAPALGRCLEAGQCDVVVHVYEHVPGSHASMHDALAVNVVERVSQLTGDSSGARRLIDIVCQQYMTLPKKVWMRW